MTTEAWSAFTNRANLSDNNNAQVMLLDTTVSIADQNQRTPVTQILRSGMNLSDLGNVSTAVTNLGATSASTANALARRDASGLSHFSSLHIDAAVTPTLNIGVSSIFTLGNATGTNQIFNGTVSGDVCIRQADTARQLLLGVGSGNAQFAVQNTVILSNIAHRFTTVGASRMPFTDGSSNLSGSASYTVNGTGSLTIAQTLTAAAGSFTSGLNAVNITGNAPACAVGPNTQYAASSATNQFFTGTISGDTCIRQTGGSNFIHIGVGGATAQFVLSSSQITHNVPLVVPSIGSNRMPFTNGSNQLTGSANYTVNGSGALTITGLFTSAGANFTANANITATNQALTFDSANQVSLGKSSASNIFFTGTVSGDGAVKVANTSNSLHLGVGSAAAQQVIQNLEIDFGVGIRLPTTGGVAGLLSHYSYELAGPTISFIITPDGTTHTVDYKYQRIGNMVLLTILQLGVSATVSNLFQTAAGAIPVLYRPARTELKLIPVINNGVNVQGCITVSNLGTVTIGVGVDGTTPFDASGLAATNIDVTIAYFV